MTNKIMAERVQGWIEKFADIALRDTDPEKVALARNALSCMALIKVSPDDPNYPGNMVPHIEAAVEKVYEAELAITEPAGHA